MKTFQRVIAKQIHSGNKVIKVINKTGQKLRPRLDVPVKELEKEYDIQDLLSKYNGGRYAMDR